MTRRIRERGAAVTRLVFLSDAGSSTGSLVDKPEWAYKQYMIVCSSVESYDKHPCMVCILEVDLESLLIGHVVCESFLSPNQSASNANAPRLRLGTSFLWTLITTSM